MSNDLSMDSMRLPYSFHYGNHISTVCPLFRESQRMSLACPLGENTCIYLIRNAIVVKSDLNPLHKLRVLDGKVQMYGTEIKLSFYEVYSRVYIILR